MLAASMMFRSLGAGLLRHWKILALGAAALAVYWHYMELRDTIKDQQSMITKQAAHAAGLESRCEANIATLRKALVDQNAAVKGLKSAAEAANASAAARAAAALKPAPTKPVGPGAANLNEWLKNQ